MDTLTCDLLTKWGCSEYISQFRAGKVDSGILRILGDDEISQLIPIPGDRARFKINLNNWKKELSELITGPEIDSLSFGLDDHSLSLGTILRHSIDHGNDLNNLFEPSTSSSPVLREQTPKDGTTNPAVTASNLPELRSVPHQTSSLTEQGSIPHQKASSPLHRERSPLHREKSLIHREGSPNTADFTPSEPGLDHCGYVLKTLKSTIDGRSLLSKKESGKLDESQRNILVKLLIQPIFEQDPSAVLTNKQLLCWSLEIQEIFNKESAALYYTPYVSALTRTTARNASGKLLRYVYNKRKQMRTRGIIEKAHSRTSSSASSANSDVAPLLRLPGASAESDEEIQEHLTWLRSSLEPWHIVEEKWAATAAYRLNANYLTGTTLQEYFNEYPALKSPSGFQLLLADFQVLFSEKTNALFTKIILMRDTIVKVAKNKLENIRDKDIKQTVQLYLNAISESEESNVKNIGALMLLPYITSSVPLKEKKKTLWKPSKSEVRDGFITQIGSDSELETTVTARKSKLQRYGKTLQPFVIYVGQSITEIQHCYVVAADTYYKVINLLSAVDICFKIIHATGANYQSESLVVWMIIQKALYGIVTPYDKELTTVKSLLIDLGV